MVWCAILNTCPPPAPPPHIPLQDSLRPLNTYILILAYLLLRHFPLILLFRETSQTPLLPSTGCKATYRFVSKHNSYTKRNRRRQTRKCNTPRRLGKATSPLTPINTGMATEQVTSHLHCTQRTRRQYVSAIVLQLLLRHIQAATPSNQKISNKLAGFNNHKSHCNIQLIRRKTGSPTSYTSTTLVAPPLP